MNIPEEVVKAVAQAIRDTDDGEQGMYDIATAAITAAIESGWVVEVNRLAELRELMLGEDLNAALRFIDSLTKQGG